MAKQPSDHAPALSVPRLTVDAVHRLDGARRLDSPHSDARPDPADISLLVVHAISLPPDEVGAARNHGYIDDLFLGRLDPAAHPYFETIRGLRVSAHACIFRDGAITQYVPFDRRAWHAGVSSYDGRERCNDYSIGVELEGSDTLPFSDAQYASLAAMTGALLRRYPRLTPRRIAGHSDVAPGRKTDPGPHFDWARFRHSLEGSPA
jgi:N-acetyl-anhydromuramoyl-L-alanine amidase